MEILLYVIIVTAVSGLVVLSIVAYDRIKYGSDYLNDEGIHQTTEESTR